MIINTWAMEMEHYLEYIDNEVWKVIQNGNSKKRVTKGKDGVYRGTIPPTTQAEQRSGQLSRQRKVRRKGYEKVFQNSYHSGALGARVGQIEDANPHVLEVPVLLGVDSFSYGQ
ncbi:hypothetical protein Tco_0685162 [Tanacetum coccineum]